jgi:beta-lactamase regulating signal transducer with metallopeptidase domain
MNTLIGNLASQLQSVPLAVLLLDALFKSFIVLALAGGVCAVWRRASAATRHLIWLLAILSLPCLSLLPSPAARQPVWAVSTVSSPANEVAFTIELAPKKFAPPAPIQPAARPASVPAGAKVGSRKMAAQFSARWVLFGWLLWLGGTAAVLLRLGVAQFGRRKFSRLAQPMQDADWIRLLQNACETLRWRRPVRLLQSADEVMPMTWGWWRPVILLPSAAARWTADRRRVVLLHELAHVKRRDYLTQVVAQLVCALYWFNPLVWLAARQMCVEREGACDDLVLAGGCKASDYAGHLVEIAGSFRRAPQMAAIAMARSSPLAGRIAAIVDVSRNRRLHPATALCILALIGGVAVCLGGSGINDAAAAAKADALRQQQIERLKTFSVEKEKQWETLAAASGDIVFPEFQRFFDAATRGDWQTVTNMHASFDQSPTDVNVNLWTRYWSPMNEIWRAFRQVTLGEPVYTQMAADDIIQSIPAGSIYFGGTEPGCGLPTAFCKSHVDADPFYILTQNELVDGSYLDYLRKTYGTEKDVLTQLAEACRADRELQRSITNFDPDSDSDSEFERLKSELSDTQLKIAEAQKESDPVRREVEISDLERRAKLLKNNIPYFYERLRQPIYDRVTEISARIQKNPRPVDPKTLYIPTDEDLRLCVQSYYTDAQKRLENRQLKPGEDVTLDQGRLQIHGQVSVIQMNGVLAKIIFDRNPGHEFFVEESSPLDWMYPYLEPHGLIMKINRQPLAEISDAMVREDQKFWQPRVTQMIGGWLNDNTPVAMVTAFGEKVFLRHDLGGFSGDPRFVQNGYAGRMFSKFRSSIAGLYAWRAENAAAAGEKERMARAADFAFRQAVALCPYAPEGATERYVIFLKSQHREADARELVAMSERFKSAGQPALPKAEVFQLRLAFDMPTDNAEPMRTVSQAGSSEHAESLYVAKTVLLDQTAIQSARLSKNLQGNSVIEISLTDAGRKQFAEITRQHIHQRLAMVIDGKLWMAPTIQTEITEGIAQVTGSFSEEEATTLVAKINGATGK